MAARIEREFDGAPDVVVNNAGLFRVAPLESLSEAVFADVLNANVTGPFLVLSAFLKRMRLRGTGHFVTIGSIADRAIFPENGAYAPAKHALRAMHEVLREELRGSGVRATLVSPGGVDTSMWDGITFGAEQIVPDGSARLSAEDVASAVMYALNAPLHVNVDELRLSHS
jgi:NADP-dependent 3-hydroxy acid dehydrogenase YdfG